MLRGQLRLGVPMGAGILIEVTGFTFMAIFIARLGPLPVAGHQITANLVALLFMVPLALSNSTSTLVAQRLGAQALRQARHLAWHGVLLAALLALLMGALVYGGRSVVAGLYTQDAAVAAAAMVLMAWVVLFHLADALQTIAAHVLRAYRVATLPVVVYAVALWGVGLGGGYALAFREVGPNSWLPWAVGAAGFWWSATLALWTAAALLLSLLAWVMRQKMADEHRPASASSG
jgi:MATE family multidrug resistance protein